MDEKPQWYELIERAKNFRGNFEVFERQVSGNEVFYMALYDLKNDIIVSLDKKSGLNGTQVLTTVFSEIFNFIIRQHFESIIFLQDAHLKNDAYEACLFTTLCMFLHDTRRIKGISLREFLYKHSQNKYSEQDSKNYFDIKKTDVHYGYNKIISEGNDRIKDEETTLRQARHRLLKTRPVYDKNPEWSGIRKDSESEWMLYFGLDKMSDDIQDTFKRIGNLYNDINKELKSLQDDDYEKRLKNAYHKFISKLKKLKYTNYLTLQKEILSHICDNREYYGINIYRFEKEFRLYTITNDVKDLLNCRDVVEEGIILSNSVILSGIYYPKLYKDFSTLSPCSIISDPARCSKIFLDFRDYVVGSSRLIIDEIIEKGYWGKDWENLFLKTVNEMVEEVFYNPKQIDYSVTPKSQEMFVKVISAPVYVEVSNRINRLHDMPNSSSESDDEL